MRLLPLLLLLPFWLWWLCVGDSSDCEAGDSFSKTVDEAELSEDMRSSLRPRAFILLLAILCAYCPVWFVPSRTD